MSETQRILFLAAGLTCAEAFLFWVRLRVAQHLKDPKNSSLKPKASLVHFAFLIASGAVYWLGYRLFAGYLDSPIIPLIPIILGMGLTFFFFRRRMHFD